MLATGTVIQNDADTIDGALLTPVLFHAEWCFAFARNDSFLEVDAANYIHFAEASVCRASSRDTVLRKRTNRM